MPVLLAFALEHRLDKVDIVLKNLLTFLKWLKHEALNLLDDHRVASQDQDRLHPLKRFLHFWILVTRSFLKNRCMIRATALAYTTLLSLIPLLAVGLGVTTSLLKTNEGSTRDMVERVIDNLVPQLELIRNPEDTGTTETEDAEDAASSTNTTEQASPITLTTSAGQVEDPPVPAAADAEEEVDARERVVETIMGFIRNTNSGGVGAIGTVTLILVAVGLLSTIEATFNDVWGVRHGRSWFARIIQYWAAITLGPLILLFATTFAVGSQFAEFQDKFFGLVPGMASLWHLAMGMIYAFLPLALVSIAFALLYKLMPATGVNWSAAAVGGGVAGLLWWLNGKLNVVFASKVVSYGTVYGSAAILPVFLLGLYLSWLILLFGCQVSYAYQNRRIYLQEKQAEIVSQQGREFVALRLMANIAQRFQQGASAPTITELAHELSVSSQLLSRLIEQLLDAHLLTEVNAPNPAYLPARPLDQISCHEILTVLRTGQGGELLTRDDALREDLRVSYQQICEAGEQLAQGMTLHSLVNGQTPAKISPAAET